MKHRIFLTVLLLYIAAIAQAQSDTAMSLKQCIDYAMLHSATVSNAKLDEYIAAAKIGETRAIGLPQINGTASVVDNPELKPIFFKGNNDFLRPSGSYTGNPNEAIPVPNIFQLRSSGEASITATQLIFNGSYLVGLKTTKTYAELATKATQKAAIDVVESVKKAYYMVLINKERLKSLDDNMARLDSVYKQTLALNKNGFVEKLDVSRLEVRRLNLTTEKQKFENLAALSLALLKFQMGMPTNQNISPIGSIEELKNMVGQNADITTIDYSQRVEYGLLETQKKLNIQNLNYINSGYMPSLAAFGTYGYTRSDVKFMNLFQKQWFSYSMIGLSLNVPIFDGFSKYYRAQQAKLEIKKLDNNIDNLRKAIDLQTTQSSITYINALKTLETQTQNITLSKEIARVTKIKYQEGVGSNIELVNAEADLKDAETNYYDSIYQVLVAMVDYQKSIGKLSAE